jgi:hypothetical protein
MKPLARMFVTVATCCTYVGTYLAIRTYLGAEVERYFHTFIGGIFCGIVAGVVCDKLQEPE